MAKLEALAKDVQDSLSACNYVKFLEKDLH